MTTLFAAMCLLSREGALLRNTRLASEHLVKTSPWFLGPYFPKVEDRPIARDLLEVLRTGQPANYASRSNQGDWHRAMEQEAFANEFIAAMDCRGLLTAQALARNVDLHGRHRLLDIAGGSGIFACALAARHPELRGSVLEKPPVDRVAARAIHGRGFADRIEVIACDMLNDPLPGGHDVHLFSNVLHDWDVDVVQRLLQASSEALGEGGLLIVHDAFLDADKTGPLAIAGYSVLLMHICQGRCYSVAEIEQWMREAKFTPSVSVETAVGRSALVAVKN
jgi:acetylserotonin N-methyltransferase